MVDTRFHDPKLRLRFKTAVKSAIAVILTSLLLFISGDYEGISFSYFYHNLRSFHYILTSLHTHAPSSHHPIIHPPILPSSHPPITLLSPSPLLLIYSYVVIPNIAIVLGSCYITITMHASVMGTICNSTESLKGGFLGFIIAYVSYIPLAIQYHLLPYHLPLLITNT